ncbi:MAG: dihydrodipicolinate synthase family protein [Gemmatimonadaceae bacterium]
MKSDLTHGTSLIPTGDIPTGGSPSGNREDEVKMNVDGVCVALVTPLLDEGKVDFAALERIVTRACDAGVVAVCPGGTTGEGPRLSVTDRAALTTSVSRMVPDNVTVIGGVSTSNVGETLAELDAQASSGANAALVTPPSRMPIGAAGLLRFYRELADRTPIPIVVYHIPQFTGVHVPPEVVLELAVHPSIAGLKDSSADIQYHLRIADGMVDGAIADFALLTGTDATMISSMQAGGTGAVLASANLVPAMGVAVHRAVRAGDIDFASAELRKLRAIVIACRRGSLPAGWKGALELTGICSRRAVSPGESLDDTQLAALRGDLEKYGVLS